MISGHITVTMQAVCNRKKKFIDVNIGWAESVHDSRVFRNSNLFDKLRQLPIGK